MQLQCCWSAVGTCADPKSLTPRPSAQMSELRCRLLLWLGTPAVLLGGVLALWGPWSFALAIAQALVGILLLEIVNYVEHYGLQRHPLGPGRYCPWP